MGDEAYQPYALQGKVGQTLARGVQAALGRAEALGAGGAGHGNVICE